MGGTPGTKGIIYTYPGQVIDVTGFTFQLLLNYRDKNSTKAADHPPGDAPVSSGIGLGWGASGLGTTPLSKLFDKLWGETQDKNGKTMRDRARAQVLQEIQSNGGTNITGDLPATGPLRALVQSNGSLLLSYWLPGAKFTFGLSGEWNLIFDTELFVTFALQNWPTPQVAASAGVDNANISPANLGTAILDALASLSNGLSSQPLNIFQAAEGQIDSASSPVPDLGPLTTLINSLGKAAEGLGFLKCAGFVDAKNRTLGMRLFHAVDPSPKVVNTALSQERQPHLVGPLIDAIPSQVAAGGELTVSGSYFSAPQADAFYIAWDDTVTGVITESDIQWSEPGKPAQHVERPRKLGDNGNIFTQSGLTPGATYHVQVRDADAMTYTDWGGLDIKTDKNNNVDLSLKGGTASVSLGTATRDKNGDFQAKVTVPAGTKAGGYTLTASDSSTAASMKVEVLGAGQSAKPKLISINTGTGEVMNEPVIIMEGATLELRGEGFKPGKVDLSIQGGPTIGAAKADTNGIFTVKPSWAAEVGTHTVVASQVDGTTKLQATLSITAEAPPS